jgi:hypothetical protein
MGGGRNIRDIPFRYLNEYPYILDGDDRLPAHKLFMNGPESQPFEPSGLAEYQFGARASGARFAMFWIARATQLGHAAWSGLQINVRHPEMQRTNRRSLWRRR